MQVTKTYSGTVSLEDAAERRTISFGTSSTVSVYPSKVDTVNTIIANFLRTECGVDAWYMPKSGSTDSFLWIWGVPFLFNIAGKNSYAAFYGPLSGSALNAGAASSPKYNAGLSTLFNGETGTYSFGLVFAGNPNNGFALRFKTYNSTSVSQYFAIRFMKCVNLINGLNSVVWGAENVYSTNSDTTSVLLGGLNGIDLNADGTIKEDSFSNTLMAYDPLLRTKPVHHSSNGGALPLVPLCVGPYRANGIYLRPVGFGIPYAVSVSTEVQAEITVSGRSFLVTNSDSININYINMGLIETT